MRPCLVLFATVLFASNVSGDEPAKTAALTAKEIADGWILLFDGETTFGWRIEGESQVKDGTLILGGTKETTATLLLPAGEFYWEFAWPGGAQGKLKLEPPPGVPHWSIGVGFSGSGFTNRDAWNATALTLIRSARDEVSSETKFNSAAASAVGTGKISADKYPE